MTFKELQKIIQITNQQSTTTKSINDNNNNNEFDKLLKGLPFWIWDQKEHKRQDLITKGNCCFNHLIGLPMKNNKEYPIFDYERLIFDPLEQGSHIWVKKSRGIGVTELVLRYLAWKALSSPNNELDNKSIFIVSGTREDFANHLKERMEKLFDRKFPNVRFESKYTELTLGNNTWIKVFPTKRIQDLRGYTDVAFLYLDEADFFDRTEQEELEYVIKAYEEKSKAQIILTSTPNKPGGMYEQIENNEIFKGFFTKLFLDYKLGLGTIYDTTFIEREKKEAYFEREYNLKYLGKIGNVFSLSDIERAVELGTKYENLPINPYCLHIGGVDFGFSSSVTAIYIAEVDTENQIVRIIFGKQYDRKTPSFIADEIHRLHREIPHLKWFVDGANHGAVAECKSKFGERSDYINPEKDINIEDAFIIPVSFGKYHRAMLEHMYELISKQKIGIPSKYDKLILSLKTAYAEDFDLDKDRTVWNDSLDALRLLLKGVKFKGVDE